MSIQGNSIGKQNRSAHFLTKFVFDFIEILVGCCNMFMCWNFNWVNNMWGRELYFVDFNLKTHTKKVLGSVQVFIDWFEFVTVTVVWCYMTFVGGREPTTLPWFSEKTWAVYLAVWKLTSFEYHMPLVTNRLNHLVAFSVNWTLIEKWQWCDVARTGVMGG